MQSFGKYNNILFIEKIYYLIFYGLDVCCKFSVDGHEACYCLRAMNNGSMIFMEMSSYFGGYVFGIFSVAEEVEYDVSGGNGFALSVRGEYFVSCEGRVVIKEDGYYVGEEEVFFLGLFGDIGDSHVGYWD